MGILLALASGFLFLASLFLPWINRSRIAKLREEVNAIKSRLDNVQYTPAGYEQNRMESQIIAKTIAEKTDKTITEPIAETITETIASKDEIITSIKDSSADAEKKAQTETQIETQAETQTETQQVEHISFEQQFGARLPVWIGGIALALAGFFMVKYSIETGLLSPAVRVVLGIIFGVCLLCAANKVRKNEGFANGTRIAQALSGAGIADLYVCIFAATNLYNLIPDFIGFFGMAAVTATAVVLSLRHGMPIALLGLIGGFLTPAMVGAQNSSAPALFIYLYFVVAGILVVIHKERWWGMAIPAVIGAFSWIFIWILAGNFVATDSLCLGLFLIAVSVTVVALSKEQYVQENQRNATVNDLRSTEALNYLTLGGSAVIMGLITAQAKFGFMEWSLFGLLSLGGIGLAFFNHRLYGFAPWMSMIVNVVMLMLWSRPEIYSFALTISIFAALYVASGYLLQSRSEQPLGWAGLTAIAGIVYFLLGYYKLRYSGIVDSIPLFWGGLALAGAVVATIALQKIIKEIPADHPQKQHIMAVYAATSTAFLSIALTIELPREFLSVAFAAQLFAITWINTKVEVQFLRHISAILAILFAFLLLPQIMFLVEIATYSLVEVRVALQQGIPIVNWPTFQLGVPALLFIGSSYLLRLQKDDGLVYALEIAAIALISVMGYYLTRHAFHADENVLFVKAGFVERGIITNILFVYGLACMFLGRKYLREAATMGGMVLCGVAIFRICYFDFLIYNPLWSAQKIGELPILNALLITYGLPILWTWKGAQQLPNAAKQLVNKYAYGFILLLAFALLSFNVRQLFNGTYLNGYETSNAEIYSYSVVWLLFGIALLFFGTLRNDKMIRIASLAIMIMTVGKVFLYDAAELEGLFRVFSFFGLGLSLLGLSWFYTRFVLINRDLMEENNKNET